MALTFSLANRASAPAHFRVSGRTDEGHTLPSQEFDVEGGSEAIGSATAWWQEAGQRSVSLEARRRTDQQILHYDPGGSYWEYRYDDPFGDTASVLVLNSLDDVPHPSPSDIGPDEPNGSTRSSACTAGVIGILAGEDDLLYAVSKTAGLWRSVQDGPWQQISGSPAYASCIAVDPSDFNLIAVGERDGDASDAHLDVRGLWESRDAGNTWAHVYNPVGDTGVQRIYAVAYGRRSHTLFLGTEIGVGRRPSPTSGQDPGISFPLTSMGMGPVTALTVGESRIWALASGSLLTSGDDGMTWSTIPIPKQLDLKSPYGKVGVQLDSSINGGNDKMSVAGFDSIAFVLFRPSVAPNDKRALADGRCDPKSSAFVSSETNCDPTAGRCTLLIYDITGLADSTAGKWTWQFTNDNDGRGLGSRRFVKSYVLNCPGLKPAIGEGLALFYGSGQGIQQALGFKDGVVQWSSPLLTKAGAKSSHIHSDLWDFHLGTQYCPPKRITAWLACDGGVYKALRPGGGIGTDPNPNFAGLITEMDWRTHNQGLHTHNIHTVSIVRQPGKRTLIAYPTTDNDGWWRDTDAAWHHSTNLGDANWTAADADGQVKLAVIARDLTQANLTGLGYQLPSGDDEREVAVANDLSFDGPVGFQLLQTRSSDPAGSRPDAVMLVKLPLRDSSGKAISDPAGGTGSGRRLAILRNRDFTANPDGPGSQFQDWRIIADVLPDGVERMWAAGGHSSPTYYLFARNDTCRAGLNAMFPTGSGLRAVCLLDGLLDGGAYFGPAFVSPYDGHILVVVATKSHPAGLVMVSSDGGKNFQPDEVLTALVSGSGRFPLGPVAPRLGEVGSVFHGATMCNPAHVVFNRDVPGEVVVASPFSGIFFANLAKGCRPASWLGGESAAGWLVATPFLPRPLSYVSSVGFDGLAVYVATEGRGLLQLDGIRSSPPASYFLIAPASAGTHLATLCDNRGSPVPWCRILTSVTQISADAWQFPNGAKLGKERWDLLINQRQVQTDRDGRVLLHDPLAEGSYLIQLVFLGDGQVAGCETFFMRAVPKLGEAHL